LKDAIDGRFMDKYQDYELMPMTVDLQTADAALPMRCAGCGGKVGGSVLSRVLARLDVPASEHVLLGLDHPDDAAIVQPPGGRPVTLTVDFFAAPLDDPYVVGRLAALNAASDVFALGGQALAALAVATIPVGKPRQQEQLLYELLAGGLDEFRKMGATLVGGHTIEGPQLTIGYTVMADQGTPRTKAGLRVGDHLILTKPLGTGFLLAAQMQAKCHAAWMETLVMSMLLSNQAAASLVDEFDIAGLTDVTGFGLGGHLLEMLNASDTACELDLSSIPLLPGTTELYGQDIESTLAPANRAAESEMRASESVRNSAPFGALFDPQTCGGLLLGVRAREAAAVLDRLAAQSDVEAAHIGHVVEHLSPNRRIEIV
jgi:selenide,water dikinase